MHPFRSIWVGMAKETAHQLGTPLSSLLGWAELLRVHAEAVPLGGRVQIPAAELAETVAEMVDGVMLVVKSDGYDVQIVQRAKSQLEKRGANLLGAVLNQVDLRQADPVLHYYYAYSAQRR